MAKPARAVKYCHVQCECSQAGLGKGRGSARGEEMHFVLFEKKPKQRNEGNTKKKLILLSWGEV